MTTTQRKTISFAELRHEAEQKNIPNFSRMRKEELETALSTQSDAKGGNTNG